MVITQSQEILQRNEFLLSRYPESLFRAVVLLAHHHFNIEKMVEIFWCEKFQHELQQKSGAKYKLTQNGRARYFKLMMDFMSDGGIKAKDDDIYVLIDVINNNIERESEFSQYAQTNAINTELRADENKKCAKTEALEEIFHCIMHYIKFNQIHSNFRHRNDRLVLYTKNVPEHNNFPINSAAHIVIASARTLHKNSQWKQCPISSDSIQGYNDVNKGENALIYLLIYGINKTILAAEATGPDHGNKKNSEIFKEVAEKVFGKNIISRACGYVKLLESTNAADQGAIYKNTKVIVGGSFGAATALGATATGILGLPAHINLFVSLTSMAVLASLVCIVEIKHIYPSANKADNVMTPSSHISSSVIVENTQKPLMSALA